jgi:hypothetical protein
MTFRAIQFLKKSIWFLPKIPVRAEN